MLELACPGCPPGFLWLIVLKLSPVSYMIQTLSVLSRDGQVSAAALGVRSLGVGSESLMQRHRARTVARVETKLGCCAVLPKIRWQLNVPVWESGPVWVKHLMRARGMNLCEWFLLPRPRGPDHLKYKV